MKNNPHDLAIVIERAKDLCLSPTIPVGAIPAQVADHLDGTFVVIPRSILPKIDFGSLDDALGGNQIAQIAYLTEEDFDGDHEKMRSIGLSYLVMADYLKNKAEKEQEIIIKGHRFSVFKELFPDSKTNLFQFCWDNLTTFERMVIDKMVLMKMELDKNF